MPSVQTKYFGTLSFAEESVFHFPQGLPAFEEEKRFVSDAKLHNATKGRAARFPAKHHSIRPVFCGVSCPGGGSRLPIGNCPGGPGRPGFGYASPAVVPAGAGYRSYGAGAGLFARRITGHCQFNGADCAQREDAVAGYRRFVGIPVIRTSIRWRTATEPAHEENERLFTDGAEHVSSAPPRRRVGVDRRRNRSRSCWR